MKYVFASQCITQAYIFDCVMFNTSSTLPCITNICAFPTAVTHCIKVFIII